MKDDKKLIILSCDLLKFWIESIELVDLPMDVDEDIMCNWKDSFPSPNEFSKWLNHLSTSKL